MHREPILRLNPFDPAMVEQYTDLMMRVFNAPKEPVELNGSRMDDQYVVEREGRVVAGYGVFRCGMNVCGRTVGLGAVAGVAVAPEARGGGLASGMMASSLDALREALVPLAALYASTFGLYRKLGYEQAGSRFERRSRTSDIHVADRALPVRAASDDDLRAVATGGHGHLVRSEGLWQRLLHPAVGRTESYIVGDGEGWVVLWRSEPGPHFEWKVRNWGYSTPAAARRLWTLLADASTMSETVSWPGPANDPMETLLPEPQVSVVAEERTMLRIIDVPAAIAGRGWLSDGVATVRIDDDIIAENAGTWRITVDGGNGRAQRVDDEAETRLHIRAFAALYSGFHTAGELLSIGRITGTPRKLSALDAIFAAPRPWMSDKF